MKEMIAKVVNNLKLDSDGRLNTSLPEILELDEKHLELISGASINDSCTNENDCTHTDNRGACDNQGTCYTDRNISKRP